MIINFLNIMYSVNPLYLLKVTEFMKFHVARTLIIILSHLLPFKQDEDRDLLSNLWSLACTDELQVM